MFKTRDFYLMKVFDIKGKYIGLVSDLNIDFYNGKVLGLFISNYKPFSKKNYIAIEDIVSMGDVITTTSIYENKGLPFRKIKNMDIYDMNNVMKGVLEDILIDTKDFAIKGLVVSSGIFDKMLKGKEILLIQNCILGENYILYNGSNNIILKTLPHNVAEMKLLEKHKKFLVTFLFLLAIILIVITYLFFDAFRDTINLILIGFIISYALKPLCLYISNKFKIKLRTAAAIIILILFLAVGGIAYFFIPICIKESTYFGAMLDNLDVYIEQFISTLGIKDVAFLNNIYEQLNEQLNLFLANLTPMLIEGLSMLIGSMMSLAVIPVVSYYFLVDGDYLYNKMLLILPTEKRVVFKKIFKNVDKVISRYIISQFLLSLIITVLTTIVLLVFNVKFAFLLGIINGVFNIIPYFGPILGMIPAVLVAFIQSPSTAIWAATCIFGIQQIEGNILSPKITADSTDMHPITIIILLLIGEKIGGLIGMIIVVPIGVMIKVVYDDINYHLF